MKYFATLIIFVIIMVGPVAAQQATLWGPGENYEIDFLHSGKYVVNGTTQIQFDKQPSTEFTLNVLTNSGYQYTYIGYNGSNSQGQVTMKSISYGIFSLDFPVGDMPVVLPLAYGSEDDWMTAFSQKLNELMKVNPDNSLFNGSSAVTSDKLELNFTASSNSSTSGNSVFFKLPQLQIPSYIGKNTTYVNTTIDASLSYTLSTGVLFALDISLSADNLLVDNQGQGPVVINQQLEFVAIIPPASIIDNALSFDFLPSMGIIFATMIYFYRKR